MTSPSTDDRSGGFDNRSGGFEDVWYSNSVTAAAVRASLVPLSAVFGAAVSVRASLYDRGLLPASRASVPVVSVGALSVGGAGKTPFVLWLVQRLRADGRRPCIVTRGYAGEGAGNAPFLLNAATAAQASAVAQAGDEGVLLALRSHAPVAVGGDRFAACELASSRLAGTPDAPDVFILDDGFQHRRLARDLDVVLVSGREASQRLMPAGPLRESTQALGRADVVVKMGAPGPLEAQPSKPTAAGRGRKVGALLLDASASAGSLVSAVTDREGEPTSMLSGRTVVAVAGIARPERFLADLERTGARIVARVLRRDHHRYDASDRRAIDEAAAHADLVVTTEKDLVKLAHAGVDAPLRALRVEVRIDGAGPEQLLLERVRAAFDR